LLSFAFLLLHLLLLLASSSLLDSDAEKEKGEGESWVNEAYGTQPKILHFNGGGKIHHLEMEKRMWYKVNEEEGKSAEELRKTKLIVGDDGGREATFEELCPYYFV
jgi:hypothetical protein